MYNNLFGTSQALNGIRGKQEGRYNTKKSPDPVSVREGRGGATPVLHPDAGPLQRAVEQASHNYGSKIRNPLQSRKEPKNYRSVLYDNVPESLTGYERLQALRQNFLRYMDGGSDE